MSFNIDKVPSEKTRVMISPRLADESADKDASLQNPCRRARESPPGRRHRPGRTESPAIHPAS
ncbi:MAG TPA: hypothetical protein VFH22_01815, partial [Rhodocyclaceae bacterium]|nr:hypothetical protein [Rhodocyclaceae bacterium]